MVATTPPPAPPASSLAAFRETVESPWGQIAVSIVLGLGLAALFRKACTDNLCVIVKGPTAAETDRYFYKIRDDCYKYTPIATPCDRVAASPPAVVAP